MMATGTTSESTAPAAPSVAGLHGRRVVAAVIGVVLGLAGWFIVAELTAARGFPDPIGAAADLADTVRNPEFYGTLAVTVRRIILAWSISFVLGIAGGLLLARSRITDGLLRPWVLVGLALPSPVAVLFAVLLLGLSEMSAILGLVLVTTPFVVNVVYENTVATPRGLLQMGNAYRFSRWAELREIFFPYISLALLAGARLALQLTWKEVLLMEALVRPDGIGERISFFYQVLQPNMLVAYMAVFALGLVGVEFLIFRPLGRYVSRWRGKGGERLSK